MIYQRSVSQARLRTPQEEKTNPRHGSNLDDRALGLDEQGQECLAHGDDGKKVGLERLARLRQFYLNGGDSIV